ncbi:MAG TPA: alpha-L-fucosidase, partial [Chitinophagaceae bacterium]
MTSIRSASVIFLFISTIAAAQQRAVSGNDAQGRISKQAQPSRYQLAWQRQEFYLFFHFGPNSFTDKEWGEGTESEDIFNPSSLDCRQWCRVAKLAGATGVIITAKHHDGFCLWPSKYSTHTVRESKWKNGKGDILRELSAACREYGLHFGVYLSPWDRNHPKYGTPAYNDVYDAMLREILANYGPIWELWWDGANGEGPSGKKQVYDWRRFERTVRSVSPSTVIFSDIGPDIRWCGNENGIAGITDWCYLDTAGFSRGSGAPSTDTLNRGNVNGVNWIPAECDVSIRPGWFYHPGEDNKVKSGNELFQLYAKSVGRGANLLLNVPPDREGLINPADSTALVAFHKNIVNNFSGDLARDAKIALIGGKTRVTKSRSRGPGGLNVTMRDTDSLAFTLPAARMANCIVLQEDLSKGQWCSGFQLVLQGPDGQQNQMSGTTVGHKRII